MAFLGMQVKELIMVFSIKRADYTPKVCVFSCWLDLSWVFVSNVLCSTEENMIIKKFLTET